VKELTKISVQGNELTFAPGDIATEDVKHVQGLFLAARDIVTTTLAVADSYVKLCRYIRDKQLQPNTVRSVMFACGFAKSRVSEVLKVASATKEKWDMIEAKALGFRKALDLTRDSVKLLNDIGGAVDTKIVQEQEAYDKSVSPATKPGEAKPTLKDNDKAEKAAMVILALALQHQWMSKKWTTGSGHLLTLTRVKKTPKA